LFFIACLFAIAITSTKEKYLEIVLNILDKTFSIRECTDKEFLKHKKCFLADIQRCTAPCLPNNKDI